LYIILVLAVLFDIGGWLAGFDFHTFTI